MALVLADRVQEYSTTTGTGTLTLSGAYAGFQTFAAGIGNGNTCYYTITSDKNQWEVGIGTVGVGTLARTTLISSSTGSTIDFKGTLTVFVTLPAEEAVYGDGTTLVAPSGALLPVASGGTGVGTLTGYVKASGTSAMTASATVPSTDVTGLGTMSTQNANAVAVTGGTINGTTVGSTTAAAGSFTTLNSSGATLLGGASGNQSLQVDNVTSAVNYARIIGTTTTGAPTYSAQGTDTNIGLSFLAKGSGGIFVGGASVSNPSLLVSTITSQVNSFQIYGNTTGNAPTLAAIGSDTNIGIAVQAKGTGGVSLSGNGQQIFTAINASGSDFTNYFCTTGGLNYTAAGAVSANISFNFTTKGAGAFNIATGGGRQAAITHTASAVNYLQLTGAATGAAPTISAQGSDANIGLVLSSKGTGVVALGGSTVANSGFSVTTPTGTVDRVNMYSSAGGNPYFEATGTSATINLAFYSKGLGQVLFGRNGGAQNFLIGSAASSVNFLQVVAAATTGAPELSAQGSDANINLKLTPKGTGTVQFGTYTAGALSPTGYITITDAGGTSRRLLVG